MFLYILSVILVSKYLQKFSNYEKTSIFSAAPGALGPLLMCEDKKLI